MSHPPSPKAETIFLAAGELAADERDAFVASACAGDDELRAEVKALMRAAELASDYFARLPRRLGVAKLRADDEQAKYRPCQGQQFGKYRLTTRLGAGGMGEVWRAERSDGRFEGEVAIKLLTRPGSKSALKQFDDEATYLAKLTHRNIARLIDAGVGPDDVPFLILDYVEGQPIDQYCNANGLHIDERLKLFIAILEAVGHAHTCLIVHSDIKPNNVLVTAEGEVKLLDFGISSLMSTMDSPAHVVGLTPEFAAPEQLAGGGITTTTDIYSLGLLLSVLLAGSNPRQQENPDSLAEFRKLAMQAPPSLTTTASTGEHSTKGELERRAAERGVTTKAFLRTMRGELDYVVRKALAVDPEDRYRSASEFAADLSHYLRNEPLTAYPDSLSYRAGKFVQRHRGSVLSGALTFVALAGMAAFATWQMVEARQQRDFALAQQQIAVSVNGFSNLLFEEIGESGEAFTLVELLDRGARALDRRRDAGRPFLTSTYYDLAQHFSNLGQSQRALELLETTATIAREEGNLELYARALCSQVFKVFRSDPTKARELLNSALPITRANSMLLTTKVECARAHATVLELDGNVEQARQVLRHAIDEFENSPIKLDNTKAALIGHLGSLHYKHGDFATSASLNEQAIKLLREDGRDGGLGFFI